MRLTTIRLLTWIRQERGQTLPEYALIIALVGLGVLAALFFVAGGIDEIFRDSGNEISSRV